MSENLSKSIESKPFMKINDAAKYTGLSVYYFRQGLKNGTIPFIKSGNTVYINIPRFLEQQNALEN